MAIENVSIKLNVNVYNTFRNLKNTLSNALSEYVDNAIQSYLNNKDRLKSYEPNYKLQVKIIMDWDTHTLSIIDNAAGIDAKNYLRAFEPANIPDNDKGLNEFGMGLKTASIWLSDNWTVTTKALGEDVERITSFDLQKVTTEQKEELVVTENKIPKEKHYTKIELINLSENGPRTNSFEKVIRYLSSIYRVYLRNDEIEIYVNGNKLEAPNYEILEAPFYTFKSDGEKSILWKKEINFEAGKYKAKGFIAILKEINQAKNGLVYLRRGRIIGDGENERNFPSCIFGSSSGTFRYKRIFGEIELEGFDVSFNKNSFKAEDDLTAFLEDLASDIKSEENNIFQQADNYRKKSKETLDKITNDLKKDFSKKENILDFNNKLKKQEEQINNKQFVQENQETLQKTQGTEIAKEGLYLYGKECVVKSYIVPDSKSEHLFTIKEDNGLYTCKINISHQFFESFPQFKRANDYTPVIELLTAFAKAEIKSVEQGTINAGNIRNLFNQFILGDE